MYIVYIVYIHVCSRLSDREKDLCFHSLLLPDEGDHLSASRRSPSALLSCSSPSSL